MENECLIRLIQTGRCAIFRKTEHGYEILLLRRSPSEIASGWWELPGGGLDENDSSFLAATKREVREETGLQINGRIDFVWEKESLFDDLHKIIQFYATACETDVKIVLSNEHDAYRWVSLERISLMQEYITYSNWEFIEKFVLNKM